MILIIAASWDTHPLSISKAIKAQGFDCSIFTTDEYSKDNYISYNHDTIQIVINGEHIDIDEISSIFVRHPYQWIFDPAKVNNDDTFLVNELRRLEVNDLVKSFIYECEKNGSFVINNFDKPIEYKLSNLLRAKEIGFNVPKTIIANDVKEFIEFKNDENEYIIKPFKSRANIKNQTITKHIKLLQGKELYNKLLTANATYPVQIQERIEKQFDLRITIAGNQIYPCVIYSQENPLTALDSGATIFENMRYGIHKLPKKIENLCFELCRKNGLNHGAIDMALDTNDKYIFFEINPYGEYEWIEYETGLKISEGMANLLINPMKYKLV